MSISGQCAVVVLILFILPRFRKECLKFYIYNTFSFIEICAKRYEMWFEVSVYGLL